MESNNDWLGRIHVASPCTAAWEEMAGDEVVRFCVHCRKNVYNLSAMSRREAEALVREREGRLCVRFYQRSDGTLLTNDCPVGFRAMRRRLLAAMARAAGTCGVLGLVAPLLGSGHSRGGGSKSLPTSRAWAEPGAPATPPGSRPATDLPVMGKPACIMGEVAVPLPVPTPPSAGHKSTPPSGRGPRTSAAKGGLRWPRRKTCSPASASPRPARRRGTR